MSDLDELQHLVGEWGQATFPASTQATILQHFAREAVELVGVEAMQRAIAAEQAKPARVEDCSMTNQMQRENTEAADCALILLHFCHRRAVSLFAVMQQKFDVCRSRQWGTPDAEGVVEHIR